MKITAGNVSVGKGAQRNESTPFPMIAHSLPYREGFDAHFPLHCTTRQTSLSSALVLHKIDHFHSPIQNDFQVFGRSGALWRKKQYMNVPYFCQNIAKLLIHCCMALQSSMLCWLLQQTPTMYILIRSHKTKESLITHISDMHPTCTQTCTTGQG